MECCRSISHFCVYVGRSGAEMFSSKVGDWKNHFLVSQNILFDEEYEKRMACSGLRFRMEL
ncbi:hypothetical protein AB205_0102970 [Aquarana catesbeiana]|uniref:Sulfotransferase n=1 Tax=Aquarana catesbeiana TaxID=8400 RepID=A0A2G9RC09_AQUCT|nr:hypothetical protein AB205_0102970 [Aquarana catesbeiana]